MMITPNYVITVDGNFVALKLSLRRDIPYGFDAQSVFELGQIQAGRRHVAASGFIALGLEVFEGTGLALTFAAYAVVSRHVIFASLHR